MQILKQLEVIKEDKNKEHLLKRYLLACCAKLSRYRSDDRFKKNLEIAKNFLKGIATKKQMHQAEWEIEGYAFGTEYYCRKMYRVDCTVDKNLRSDLLQVYISKGLSNQASRDYLVDLAYFIDAVFCYVQYSDNWLFGQSSEKFLCPRLFKRFFTQRDYP